MDNGQEAALDAAQEVVPTEATEAEASEATESTEGEPSEAPSSEEPEQSSNSEEPAKTRGQRRRERREASERETLELKEQLAQSKQRLTELEEVSQSTKLPQEGDYATLDEYQAALSAHHSLKAFDGREAERATKQMNEHSAAVEAAELARKKVLAEGWQEQLTDAKTRYADFDAVFDDTLPITTETAEMISQSDVGADVAYHLGTNRELAAQIAKMNPLDQARHIGRIEATINVPRPKKTTTAPDPIDPVSGQASTTKSPESMTQAEFNAWREAGGKY